MGTDIHGRLQRRWHEGGVYEDIGPIEDDRNYRVFAMLAGVRNGRGCAGVKTHEPLVPISEPRGLPDPLYRGTKWDGEKHVPVPYDEDDDGVWFGDHSFSWLTLSEVLDWDGWDKPLHMSGILDAAEFQRVESEGDTPNHWSGGITGPGVVIVSAEQARAGVSHTHVEYSWSVPFRDCTKTFRAWLDWLQLKYGWPLESDPAAVRLVFGFDS